MRITETGQVDSIRTIIGDENAVAISRALDGGCLVWFFANRDELDRVQDELTPDEKLYCHKRFDDGESWAGIVRPPELSREEIHTLVLVGVPVTTSAGHYDTHGNWHPNTPAQSGNWGH